MEYTRITNDSSGNPRFVVHFLNFNTDEEIKSSFLTWSDQKYALAAMRAKYIGARAYKAKEFGGCFVFQSYESNIAKDVNKAFENFESSTTADKAQREIRLTVMNDTNFYNPCHAAMRAVFDGSKANPKAAFSEILHQCTLCAESLKKRFGTRISKDAIWYGACMVAMDFEESVTFDLKNK